MKCLVRFLIIGLVYLLVLSTIVFPVNCITSLGNFSNDTITSSGNIYYVGGTGPNNYTKIQDAIDNTSDGDTVFVYSGIYYENIMINTSIDLIGEDMYSTIIDGQNKNMFDTVYIIAHGVTMNGFTIQNSGKIANGPNLGPDAGIDIRTDDNIITGNRIINNYAGIFFRTSYNNVVSHNIISENDRSGISLSDWTSDNVISENTITENEGDGISAGGLFENYNNDIIYNQISYNEVDGIYLADSHHYLISDNMIFGNRYHGICLISGASNHNIIGNNISFNTWGIRFLGSDCNDSYISGNSITENYYGVWIAESSNNDISNNEIAYNVNIGLFLLPFSYNNSICQNNFINNSPNCFFWGSKGNYWNENYWGRFRIMPKLIFGVENILEWLSYYILVPRIAFDMNPAHYPYEI